MTNTEAVLFVGGRADGQRMTLDSHMQVVRVPYAGEEIDDRSAELCYDTYCRMQIAGERERYSVFRFEGITVDDVMVRLITQYAVLNSNP